MFAPTLQAIVVIGKDKLQEGRVYAQELSASLGLRRLRFGLVCGQGLTLALFELEEDLLVA